MESDETLARHSNFFSQYEDAPVWVYGEFEGVLYALVYDAQRRPRLTVDLEDQRARIDVWTGAVLDGDLGESELAVARRLVRNANDVLSERWQVFHESAKSRRRINELADYLETLPPTRYDQTRVEHDDGTPACLVAHALSFFAREIWNQCPDRSTPHCIKTEAARVLGLEYSVVGFLYHGRPLGFDQRSPTPKEAAAMLRGFADGKGIVWRRHVEESVQS